MEREEEGRDAPAGAPIGGRDPDCGLGGPLNLPPSRASRHIPTSPSSDPRLRGPRASRDSWEALWRPAEGLAEAAGPLEASLAAGDPLELVLRAELNTFRSWTCALSLETSALRSAVRWSPASIWNGGPSECGRPCGSDLAVLATADLRLYVESGHSDEGVKVEGGGGVIIRTAGACIVRWTIVRACLAVREYFPCL